jgi:hypothetical protein
MTILDGLSATSMRRPVRVKTVLFFLPVDPYFSAEPPLCLCPLDNTGSTG